MTLTACWSLRKLLINVFVLPVIPQWDILWSRPWRSPAHKVYQFPSLKVMILVIKPRSWVSHEQPHLKPCCSGAMMMSYCMMLLMIICENLALVADDTGEGNWLEPFWMVGFLKTCVISVVLQTSGTMLLLNAELMIKVILIAGAILSYSWSCQQLLVWNNQDNNKYEKHHQPKILSTNIIYP